jgi:hypothetical protein
MRFILAFLFGMAFVGVAAFVMGALGVPSIVRTIVCAIVVLIPFVWFYGDQSK